MWRRSRACNGSSSCVEIAYRKAVASTGNGECVEAGVCSCGDTDQVWVRDSKLGDDSAVLRCEASEWSAFVDALRADEPGVYSGPILLVPSDTGPWFMSRADAPDLVLVFDSNEVEAFRKGAELGEFDFR